ncbi:hypothetical protein ACQP1W_28345 [Spirillospora sp. CA-255316]
MSTITRQGLGAGSVTSRTPQEGMESFPDLPRLFAAVSGDG